MRNIWFIPCTPAGTACIYAAGSRGWNSVNASRSKEQAIKNIVADAAHMPYQQSWKVMQKRGYTIERWNMPKGWRP